MMSLWDTILGRSVWLEELEDNEATIKVVSKGFSQKLRRINRTHKVNLASLAAEFKPGCATELKYVNTKEQAADIFTKALEPSKWDAAMEMLNIIQKPPHDG